MESTHPCLALLLCAISACSTSAERSATPPDFDATNGGRQIADLEQIRSFPFISDPHYIPSAEVRAEDIYLRVFGRYDNRENFFVEAPEMITRSGNSISIAGDGGFLFNEKLTLITPTKFRIENDRGGPARLERVYQFNGKGWVLETRSIRS
jgi:hypothetical protein